jgi:uncharacterized protein
MPSPRYAREIPQRYRLEAGKCASCAAISFPPRVICPACGSRGFETVKLCDRGEILTYTIIRVAPQQFSKQVPYAVAIVALDDGARITAQVVDCRPEDVAIGRKVRMVFRKIQEEGKAGLLCYGYKCRLE